MLKQEDLQRLATLVREGRLSPDTLERLVEPADEATMTERRRAITTLVHQAHSGASMFYGATMTEAEAAGGDDPAEMAATDRYTLGDMLGRGGGGTVWLATDDVLARSVAVKVMLPQAQIDAEHRARFLYEARATARLAHPGVIPVYDAGMLPDGRPFYTMQRVAGRSLGDVVDALRRGDAEARARYPLPRLLNIFVQICQTVAYAHDHGFVHRDLKPANVMLGSYGEVFVGDWGLVKPHSAVDPALERPESRSGATVGTVEYMSPEQVRASDDVGPPSDVYSLGIVLFELMTLRLPFHAASPLALMLKIVRERVPDPRTVAGGRDVPGPLAELCLRATEPLAAERHETAASLAEKVTAFLDGVEEQRRRAAAAREQLARARAEAERFEAARAAAAEQQALVEAARAALPPDAPLDARRALWRDEEAVRPRALAAEAHFGEAVRAAEQALELVDHDEAHALLADLYWHKYREARGEGQPAAALFFADRVKRHDRGQYARRLDAPACVEVDVLADGATVTLEQQVALGPLLEPKPVEGPVVPAGSYIVSVRAPGRVPVRWPVRVEAGEEIVLGVDPPPVFPGHEAFCFVPRLTADVGGDPMAHRGQPRRRVTVGPFFIGRHLITLAEYVRFLDAVAAAEGVDAALARAPRTVDGTIWVDVDEVAGRFHVPAVDQDGDAWDPQWPAHMVNRFDAQAYCAWRSAQDGAAYRLPTAVEWEVAARGVDGRGFPWGHGFDPTLAKVIDTPGPPGPCVVGSFPDDRSPFGVMDMAGLVHEWTATDDPEQPGRAVLKGAGNRSHAVFGRAAGRISHRPDVTGVQFGFRLVREP
ncbi:MAG: SUMF1/EgtB/PvdO family nonheme iron enzyme [Myxococcales bacterium]|nr:SUMF1/EgtB/PvdO family nonheme iron enzyme [Myxococcales bacterium]